MLYHFTGHWFDRLPMVTDSQIHACAAFRVHFVTCVARRTNPELVGVDLPSAGKCISPTLLLIGKHPLLLGSGTHPAAKLAYHTPERQVVWGNAP